MRIIEIALLSNGAHRNQNSCLSAVPSGWAAIPDDIVCENFPFGEVIVEEINGVPTVTSWVPGTIPESEETETDELVAKPDIWDELDAAYQEGVDRV